MREGRRQTHNTKQRRSWQFVAVATSRTTHHENDEIRGRVFVCEFIYEHLELNRDGERIVSVCVQWQTPDIVRPTSKRLLHTFRFY